MNRHRRTILLGSILLSVLSAVSLLRLRLDFDVLNMLPAGRPAFDDFKSFVSDFGELNELVVMIEGEPLDELKAFAEGLAERLAAADTVRQVHLRTDLTAIYEDLLGHYVYNYVPVRGYATLADRLTPAGLDQQMRANRAMLSAPLDLGAGRSVSEDPLGARLLAARALADSYAGFRTPTDDGYVTSPDRSALLLFVEPDESAFDIFFSERLLDQVRAAEAASRRSMSGFAVRVAYTGSYVYALEDAATLRTDIRRYAMLALVGVLAVFLLSYRTLRLLPYVAYPLVVTSLLTFAFSLVLFDTLNALSLAFAAILYGLSIDSGIHFYTRLLQERQRHEATTAVTVTLAGLGRAHVTASLTNIAVFCLVGLSYLGAVRQLGILCAVGLLFNAVEFFTLYPVLGFLLVRRPHVGTHSIETPRLGRVARFAAERAKPLGLTASTVGLLLIFLGGGPALDASLNTLRPQNSSAMQVEEEIASTFGQAKWAGAILVQRPSLQQALSDSESVARKLAELQAAGDLQSFQSIRGLLPSKAEQRKRLTLYNQLPRLEALERFPAVLQRNGFRLKPFEKFFQEFRQPRTEILKPDSPMLAPFARILSRHIASGPQGHTVAVYVQMPPGGKVEQLARRLAADLRQIPHSFASRLLLENELEGVLRRERTWFFLLALVGNFIVLLISLRSVRAALGLLWPTILVVVSLLALMRIAGIDLNPVNLIVIPLLVGLSLDDGLFILAAAGKRADWGIALRHAGRAVVVTSLTTIAGFGFLALSRFPALAKLGLVAAVGFSLSLVSSIVLVPALLTVMMRGSIPQGDATDSGRTNRPGDP